MKTWMIAVGMTAFLLAACGQAGDLYLPGDSAAKVEKPEQPEQKQKPKSATQ